MRVEGLELRMELEKMKDTKDDEVGRSFNHGLDVAIRLIQLHEDSECVQLARWGEENGYSRV